jgi:hypothetical protein
MIPKQKLKSLEKKMERIQNWSPDFDFKLACRYFSSIQKYNELQREYFMLKFEIEHCKTCGKKL